jgi:GDP-mannose 6-dehydrogenase
MKVAVFGLGYAGTVSAGCIASGGHDVWGVDIDAKKVSAVARGSSPVVERGLDDIVAAAVRAQTLHATTDARIALDGAECALICVGTPSTDYGNVDLSHVEAAAEEIGRALATVTHPPDRGLCVVVRSTVPPGTVHGVVAAAIRRTVPGEITVNVAACPEFLREGSGVDDFFDPPFTVIGVDDAATGATVSQLFSAFDARVRIVPVRTAEALKYACNAFHATKVAFANEIARVFRTMNVDAREVMELFCEDDRLTIAPAYLRPGFAFGGSCLPKDLRALLHLGRMNNVDLPLLAGTIHSNEITISSIVDRVVSARALTVALLGLSFKMQTDDLRESPYVTLAETLIGKGFDVRIHDPIVNPSRLVGTNSAYINAKLPHLRRLLADTAAAAIRGADVVIVSSSDPAVADALVAEPPPLLLDLNGRLGPDVEALPGYAGSAW